MRKIIIRSNEKKYPSDKYTVYHVDEFLGLCHKIKTFWMYSDAQAWAERSGKKFGVPVEAYEDEHDQEWHKLYGK